VDTDSIEHWRPLLWELCDRLREGARAAMARALMRGDLGELSRPVGAGAGDVTFGLDEITEELVDTWLEEVARRQPLSLLTEDRGWRHAGPGTGGPTELPGFDHGGPRIAVDPVDGTRNLMNDLRSAWTTVALAGPGPDPPRLSAVELGIVGEIPTSPAALYQRVAARRGGPCESELRGLVGDRPHRRDHLQTGEDDRPDSGYFPFFRFAPDLRPLLAELEADFFARLAAREGAAVEHCFDDQYITNAGQLVLLAQGTYRMIADLRGEAGRIAGCATITSKPYDLAGAVVCARAAGCVLTDPDGGELDFPLDATTPVTFVGWVNPPTRARLEPHLQAALGALRESS